MKHAIDPFGTNVARRVRRVITGRRGRIALGSAVVVAAATAGIGLTATGSPAGSNAPNPTNVAELGQAAAELPRARSQETAPTPSGPANPTTATPSRTATRTPEKPSSSPSEPPAAPEAKTLDYEFQAQINYYYCGPAATRIALTVRDVRLSQDEVARPLGTTTSGTNSAHDTTRVLNSATKTDFYRTTMIPGNAATPAQMDQLQADVVHAVHNGYAVVANVAGSATDVAGGWHSYPGGHYVTVVGYRDDGRTVKIADPAIPGSDSTYWMTTIALAHWIATRGYSA